MKLLKCAMRCAKIWKCVKVWGQGFRQQVEATRGRGSGVFRVCQSKEGKVEKRMMKPYQSELMILLMNWCFTFRVID